jgi:hypothetical protein
MYVEKQYNFEIITNAEFDARNFFAQEAFERVKKAYNIQNIEQATFLTKSPDYKALLEKIKQQEELLHYIPLENILKRNEVADILNETKKQLSDFKSEVLSLADIFTKREINTDRLRLAKIHFDKGEFREVNAILNVEEINQEVEDLKQDRIKMESDLAENNTKLESKANEYIILAHVQVTLSNNPNWFENALYFFKCALDVIRTDDILVEFANFLLDHNQFKRAIKLYKEALLIRKALAKVNPTKYLPRVVTVCNNLAMSQKGINRPKLALANYDKALKISRKLDKDYPIKYVVDIARSLNNLAIVKQELSEPEEAFKYYEEALGIYKTLALESPGIYSPLVANTLNNLGVLLKNKKEFDLAFENLNEGIKIIRDLLKVDSEKYLETLATLLNNMGLVQKKYIDLNNEVLNKKVKTLENGSTNFVDFVNKTNDVKIFEIKVKNHNNNLYDQVQNIYEEAIGIRITLSEKNPKKYSQHLASTLNNLADLQRLKIEEDGLEKALVNYQKALRIYEDLAEKDSRTYLPEVAVVAYNVSTYYLQCFSDKENSGLFASKVIEIAEKFPELPRVQEYSKSAKQVLEATQRNN